MTAIAHEPFSFSAFRLTGGEGLPDVALAHATRGALAADGRNAILATDGYTSGPGHFCRIEVPALHMLSRTDAVLPPPFPPPRRRRRCEAGVDATYIEIDSEHGHLGSGADAGKWAPALRVFISDLEGTPDMDMPVTHTDAVDLAITSRRSIRRFLPTPVPATMAEAILGVAARAPSGTNMQPWRGYVLAGSAKQALCDAVQTVFDRQDPGHTQEVQYYPDAFFEPYLSRRRAVGWDLYGLLGIGRGDAAKMKAQHRRNFQFFDAPVGMIFTINRRLATGSWLDYGMFLENVMITARGRGLDTCAQAAWSHYHLAIRPVLGLDPEEVVICGMALGYADRDAPENSLATTRASARDFMRFDGFEDAQ